MRSEMGGPGTGIGIQGAAQLLGSVGQGAQLSLGSLVPPIYSSHVGAYCFGKRRPECFCILSGIRSYALVSFALNMHTSSDMPMLV